MAAQLLVHINEFVQLLHKDEFLINSEWSIYSSVLPSVYVVYPSAPAIYFNPSVTALTVCLAYPRPSAFCQLLPQGPRHATLLYLCWLWNIFIFLPLLGKIQVRYIFSENFLKALETLYCTGYIPVLFLIYCTINGTFYRWPPTRQRLET